MRLELSEHSGRPRVRQARPGRSFQCPAPSFLARTVVNACVHLLPCLDARALLYSRDPSRSHAGGGTSSVPPRALRVSKRVEMVQHAVCSRVEHEKARYMLRACPDITGRIARMR